MDVESILAIFIETSNLFLDSRFFLVVKFIIAIYVTVLFVDVVLLLVLRGLLSNIRNALKGTDMPIASKKKIHQRWVEIENRISLNQSSQYKLAILEADGMVNEILSEIGYSGRDMMEKLEGVTDKQIKDVQLLKHAHKIRNEIINNRNFFIDKENSEEIVNIYKNFLEYFEII